MISEPDKQLLYDKVSDRVTAARVDIAKLSTTSLTKQEALKRAEEILAKAQDDISTLAVSVAATLRSVKDRDAEVSRLTKALYRYDHCRHGCEECNCTAEARAVLYPYLKSAAGEAA